MEEQLTQKQTNVLKFLKESTLQTGIFPSLAVIAKEFGITRVSAKRFVDILMAKGLIERNENRQGYFNLSDPQFRNPDHFQVVASISAGAPVEAYEESDDRYINLTPKYFGSGEHKILVVSGESMQGDHICDGDLAIIKIQKSVRGNDIAAVRVEGEGITLKRIRKEADRIALLPSNESFKIRIFPSESVEVIGKFVGLVRKQ